MYDIFTKSGILVKSNRFFTLVFSLLCFTLTFEAFSQKVYYSDGTSISRANLNGSSPEVLITTGSPSSLFVDASGGRLYYTDGGLMSANLDGTDPVATGIVGGGRDYAFDFANGKVYYIDGFTTLRRANLDGSGVEILQTTSGAPGGVAVDIVGQRVFWTSGLSIYRMNFNGTGFTTLNTTSGTTYGDIVLDPTTAELYVVRGTEIRKANQDGGGMTTFANDLMGNDFTDLGIDLKARALYASVDISGPTDDISQFNLSGGFPNSLGRSAMNVEVGIPAEINIAQGGSNLVSGSGNYSFGGVAVGSSSSSITFTIENSGGEPIITNEIVNKVGGNTGDFIINSNPPKIVGIGGSVTFSVTFSPTAAGARSTTLSIPNNDPDESPYTFTVSGTGQAPEIDIIQGSSIASGTSYNFGSRDQGTSTGNITFTISNTGTADLTLTGTPDVIISGTNAGDFAITQPGTSTIAGSSSTTFSISFTPGGAGARTATITIPNNDSDEGSYTITLNGTGLVPEIDIVQGSSIASGTSYNFGNIDQGISTGNITFTINNTGTGTLDLTGSPDVIISGTNAGDFAITQPATSTVANASSTTFSINFTPGGAGSRTATITIPNNDSDEGSYTITLNGTGLVPEIDIVQGSSIASGTSYNFGNIDQGTSTGNITFTINNTGNGTLNLTGTPDVIITGTNAGDFVVTQPATSTVANASSTTFSINFTPGGAGSRTATITIPNNDSDEGSYTITLNGTGLAPEIDITQGSVIGSGGSYNFGNVDQGSSSGNVTFTINNTGTGTLNLTGTPDVVITGTHAGDFAITQPATSTVSNASSTTFLINFTPGGVGARTATITIPNNDSDEGSYTITLNGAGVTPEIDITQGSSIASGTSYDFGSLDQGSSTGNITFTINNSGAGTLNLTGTPDVIITGTNAADFAITQPATSTIANASSTTFAINFTPGGVGARTATITIPNNDSDEGSYTITLNGTGTSPAPEINISQGGSGIANGMGSFNFGVVNVGASSAQTTFTIANAGTATLNLSGVPRVQLSGANADQFTVNTQPASTVASASSTTFDITFTPTTPGVKVATVTILNDDSDDNPYTFSLTGSGTQAEINVRQGATPLAVNSIFDFGSISVASGNNPVTFTIENTGSSTLNLTGTPRVTVSGTHASDFTVTTQPATATISAMSNTTFVVTFDPSAGGTRNAVITIANDDADEGTYTINLTGLGAAPLIGVTSGGNAIAAGSNTPTTTNNTSFGGVQASTSSTNTYTITNTGTENLVLSGAPIINVSGANAGNFSVNFTPPAGNTLNPSQTVNFDITFNAPATPGTSNATITIGSNANNASSFTFNIQANAVITVDAPSNVTVNATGLAVQLNWTDNANNEDEFIIERSTDGTNFSELTRVAQNITTYTDNTVVGNTTYFYRIVASNAFDTGTSASVSISIGDILSPPTGLSATATSDEAILTWQDVNTSETGYAIYRAPVLSGGVPGVFQLVFKTQPNETKYTDIGLTPSTNYYYRLLAVALNPSNNSALTSNLLVQTQGVIPVTPSNLNALAISQTEIQVEWKDNSTNESGFQVLRSSSGNAGTFALIHTTAANVEVYVDQGLTSKTTYYYQIRANSTDGPSPFTNPVQATTLSNAPDSPTDLVALPISGTQVQLNWVDNSTNEGGFIISRAVDQFGAFTAVDTVAADVTIYADTGLTENTNYFYFVQAFNSDGPSEFRTNIAAARTANVPLIPRSVQITVNSATSVTISWVLDAAPSTVREATGFRIEAANILGIRPPGGRITKFANGKKVHRTSEDDDLIFFELGTTTANVASFVANGLIANQQYIFRVRSFNDNGNSPYSPESKITTSIDPSKSPPSAPSSLIAESVSQSEIDISWQDNSDNELVFKIERKREDETNWTEIGQVISGTTSFSSTNLEADKSYSYRVRASNEGGDSDYTNIDSTRSECNLLVLINNASGSSNTICSGKAALLEVKTNVTDAVYQWKRNGINIPNANLPVYNADRTGEYDCQIISGECRKAATTPVIVIVEPSFGVTIRVSDSTTQQLESSVKGAQAYQWFRDYQPITGAIESIYEPPLDGVYFVVVTNEGCSATSNLITVTKNATGIAENTFSKSIRLSPNPADGISLLEMTNEIYGKYQIIITDMQGRVQMILDGQKQQKTLRKTLPVQALAQGVYLVKVQMKDQEGVQKLVKK